MNWECRFYTTIGSEGIAELRAKQYLVSPHSRSLACAVLTCVQKWMWVHIEEGIMREFKASKGVQEQLPHIHRQVDLAQYASDVPPDCAAARRTGHDARAGGRGAA